MIKSKCSLLPILLVLYSSLAYGQEALFGGQQIVSPQIQDDQSVTFRVFAPNADTVLVTGDFLPTVKIQTAYGEMDAPGKARLTKDSSGVWEYRSAPLEPELYKYTFIIDGITAVDHNNPFIMRDVASLFNIFIIDGAQADLYKVNDIPHGTVGKYWYDSPGLGMDRRLTVYTPPGYETSNMEYPVLYLLHGAGGDEEAWTDLGRAPQIFDNLIAQGKAQPMIVVMPNGNVSQDAAPGQGKDGYYKPQFMIPGTMNGRYEENFMDIVHFVEATFRVKADKTQRAIAGLSMGGFHSMHISRYFPNTFDYVGLFSAAIMPREDATGKVYQNIDGTLQAQMNNGLKLYWIGIGKSDFLYQANVEFRQKLDDIGMAYTYRESDGGHTWVNWRIYLSEFVPQLFR